MKIFQLPARNKKIKDVGAKKSERIKRGTENGSNQEGEKGVVEVGCIVEMGLITPPRKRKRVVKFRKAYSS